MKIIEFIPFFKRKKRLEEFISIKKEIEDSPTFEKIDKLRVHFEKNGFKEGADFYISEIGIDFRKGLYDE